MYYKELTALNIFKVCFVVHDFNFNTIYIIYFCIYIKTLNKDVICKTDTCISIRK